ncbi:hypothetical protein H6776_00240 [Candidatus Nomurabacteria bacterium]|nr:hypothetical protein [Candidatus Nomurabacteria bacterium]
MLETAHWDSAIKYFEGEVFFEPLNKYIEYFIDAVEKKPTDKQRNFYIKIQRGYQDLVAKSANLIKENIKDWDENVVFKIDDFSKKFLLVAINILNLEQPPIEWDLAFDMMEDEGRHQLTIYFENDELVTVGIDG